MMKIRIEGIDVHYKNVADLNTKVHEHLAHVRSKRQQATAELRQLTKKERALTRFLGVQREGKDSEPTPDSPKS